MIPRLLVFAVFVCPIAAHAEEDAETLFETRVRPLLAQTCFKCHGGEKTALGLRVDSRDALLAGGKGGPTIVPGKPEASRLLAVLEYRDDGELQMPPAGKLPPETIAAVASWIKRGAPWPAARAGAASFAHEAHWAYLPIGSVAPPEASQALSRHPIDRFIAEAWEAKGLHPVAQADKPALIRRACFDLLGLPPSPKDVAEFVQDGSPDAWPRLIDRLLASPQYGERWGRHWMDVVRYADTAGDNADYPVPEARLYRDYIIDSFNADKPFDQFVREQVAGDILATQSAREGKPREKFAELTVATGFLALSRRYATAPYELWHLTLEDTIDTVGRAFLGQTFKCARCHDHKFDPITQEDYYALYGMFSSTQFPWAGGEEFASKQTGRLHFPTLAPPAEVQTQVDAHAEKTRRLESMINQMEQAKDREAKAQLPQAKAELRELLRTGVPSELPGAYAVREGTPADSPLHQKGDPAQPGQVVARRMPGFVKSVAQETIPRGQSGRLQLARWLTSPDHPLTARVMANRIWLGHFGKGIVGTPSNFGTRGERPTHPQLLDYLARYLIEQGWSIKAMHRLILTSKVWQLSTENDEACAALDPENRFYWRFDRRRLDAESMRDALLTVAGTLDPARPAEHPFPDIKTWTWTQHKPFKDVYPSPHRSVYLMTQRIQRHPLLGLFDGPDTNTTTEMRTSSTVPLQALFWMNSPFVKEQAQALAWRLIGGGDTFEARLNLAFRLAYGREPTAVELERFGTFLTRYRDELARNGADATRLDLEAWTSIARTILSSNEFVYVD